MPSGLAALRVFQNVEKKSELTIGAFRQNITLVSPFPSRLVVRRQSAAATALLDFSAILITLETSYGWASIVNRESQIKKVLHNARLLLLRNFFCAINFVRC